MSENEYLLKICIIGSPQKLKTTFIRRFAERKFETYYLPTQGVVITTKKIQIDNYQVKLILVDTAGQEFFGRLRPSYYRGLKMMTMEKKLLSDRKDLVSNLSPNIHHP